MVLFAVACAPLGQGPVPDVLALHSLGQPVLDGGDRAPYAKLGVLAMERGTGGLRE